MPSGPEKHDFCFKISRHSQQRWRFI